VAFTDFGEGIDGAYNTAAYLLVNSSNKLQLNVWVTSPSSQWTNVTGTTTLQSDTWYHFYAAFSDNDKYELYLNGTLDGNNNGHSYATIAKSAYPHHLTLGCRMENGDPSVSNPFDGTIDEVAVYSKAFSTDEALGLGCGKEWFGAGV